MGRLMKVYDEGVKGIISAMEGFIESFFWRNHESI